MNAVPLWVIVLVKSAIVLLVVITTFAYSMLFERKIMGWMQLRPGPNRVGPWGMMQPAADAVKMMFKEDLTPETADPLIYKLAPFISLICAMGVFAVIPFSQSSDGGIWGVGDVNAGLLFVFAISSIGIYGISLAGWSSGSKFPLLGSVRSTAQMISYELSMTMSVVGVLILAGTTSLKGIVNAQNGLWFIIPQFIGFLIYIVTAVAETNRAPFDLVEAETELVAGFHTEYSGLRFGLFFIAEYLNMITVSCLATLLFLGGWNPLFGLSFDPGLDLVRREGGAVSVHVHLAAHDAAAPALRSLDGLRVEGAAAGGDGQLDCDGGDRRGGGVVRKNLFNVRALAMGFATTLQYAFRKKPTIEYPTIKKQHAPRFHGLHELRRYDDGKERCIGCELCSIACPANAITVIGEENTPENRLSPGERHAGRYEIDELRCIFCGMCEEACPTDAIVLTPRFEMADYRRGSFVYAKDRLLVPPEAGRNDPPDERPNGIPPDLGEVAEKKSTIDVADGYPATHRGTILIDQRRGLAG